MSELSSHPVDVHVGARVRLRRKFMNLSQSDLGDDIGLTFQQVQKYERGTNRISASKLWHIGRILKVPIDYFFEGLGEGDAETEHDPRESAVNTVLATAEGVELAQAFPTVRGAKRRRKLVDLVKSMAEEAEA